jgi:hypothetical protein
MVFGAGTEAEAGAADFDCQTAGERDIDINEHDIIGSEISGLCYPSDAFTHAPGYRSSTA